MTPPRPPQSAEEVLSVLSMATRGLQRLDNASPEEVKRLRSLISDLDREMVQKWRA